jgi:hypothetical protein
MMNHNIITKKSNTIYKMTTQWTLKSLDYMTPIAFTQKYSKVSKRYSSNTGG